MPKQLTAQQKVALELLVDATSLADVIDTLGTIAMEKGEHVRTNWQDKHTAHAWERAGKRLTALAMMPSVGIVSGYR